MIRNLIGLFGTIVAFMLWMAVYHQNSVKLMVEQPVPIEHWEDPDGRATITDVRQADRFTPVRQRRFNAGYTESIHWFRFRLRADSGATELSFEIRNHTIDRLDLFAFRNGTVSSLGQTGSRFPFGQRPSPTKTFVYLLTVEPGQPTEYYLRLDKRYEDLATELTLWQTADFEDKEEREYFLWGIFAGVVGLIVGLAFLFYGTTRDRDAGSPVYGWYGLYVLFLAFRQFADTGLGFQYLWPHLPTLNHPDALIMALWLYLPAMLQFQQEFLQLRTASKPVFRATQFFKYTYWALFISLVIAQFTGLTEAYAGSYQLVRSIHAILTNGTLVVFAAVVVVGWRSSDTVKRLYVVGVAIQNVGQLLVVAQHLTSFRADGLFVMDAHLILMVNFFVDLVVFTYLLAYRYRKSIDEERRLQVSLAQMQQRTNDAIIDLLESERQQVGHLLLTDVGGRIARTQAVLADLPPAPLLTETVDLLTKTDATLDQILHDSLPPDLTRKGLATALAELVEQHGQTGLRLSFAVDDYPPGTRSSTDLSATQTGQLYRIANELITNLVKHAGATEGRVTLRNTPAGRQLTVSDNGRGFDPAQTQTTGGIGLKNLHARAQTLDAEVRLDSGPTGTTITVLVPEKIQTS